MRILSAMFDWAVEGGVRRFVYRLLGAACLLCLTDEVMTNGLTGDAYIYAFVAMLMFVGLYDDD